MQLDSSVDSSKPPEVSILTRPGGRVQQPSTQPEACSCVVSILTRPGGRVQPEETAGHPTTARFNPHPSRRTGATSLATPCAMLPTAGFNPHPSRRTGATGCPLAHMRKHAAFQSSPVPEDGCNYLLTFLIKVRLAAFQSSPVPEDGCNSGGIFFARLQQLSFNPHPSRRTGATKYHAHSLSVYPVFQSSPVPEDGCNQHGFRARSCVMLCVSILTRPGGRVQQVLMQAVHPTIEGFNPHPSRRTGATCS